MLQTAYLRGLNGYWDTGLILSEGPPQTFKTPYFSHFQENLKNHCATTVQQFYTNTTKYLSKRVGIYYFTRRFGDKVYKLSLKSSDLEFCKLQRDKIMQQLAEYNVNDINWKNPTRSNFHISFEV